jgi:UDP-glucose 4-epimerase
VQSNLSMGGYKHGHTKLVSSYLACDLRRSGQHQGERMMKVVITGGAGFLGSHVAEEFAQYGHQVVIFDRLRPSAELAVCADVVQGDLLDLEQLADAFRGADAVCHLAGVGDVYLAASEPFTAAAYNALGTANVAEAAQRNGIRKLVYASTWEVYGTPEMQPVDESHPCRPDHPYNITKYAGELLALSYDRLRDLPTLALRLGTAYGLRMRPTSVFSVFIGRARAGEPIVISGSGDQTRQFTHARDIALGFRLAVEAPIRGEAINLTADESISVRQLAESVTARLPVEIRFGMARQGDIHPAIIDSSRARDVLGWQPRMSFDEGLNELIEASVHAPQLQPTEGLRQGLNGMLASADKAALVSATRAFGQTMA